MAPPERYAAVVVERVGPFTVQFPLEIQVLEVEEPRRLVAAASGRDAAAGSALRVTLDLRLEPAGAGSRLAIASEASILAALGTLGCGIIQHTADGMTWFADALWRELEAEGRAGRTTARAA